MGNVNSKLKLSTINRAQSSPSICMIIIYEFQYNKILIILHCWCWQNLPRYKAIQNWKPFVDWGIPRPFFGLSFCTHCNNK